MTREEAVAWLVSVGRNAYPRDWVMGATIAITLGQPSTEGAITVHPGVVYLHPVSGAAWNLWDPDLPDPAGRYDSLEEAVRRAHEHVSRKEAARAEGR